MAEIEKKPIKITETVLRDAHQSLIATRMTTEQMLPIVEKMDKVGYQQEVYRSEGGQSWISFCRVLGWCYI